MRVRLRPRWEVAAALVWGGLAFGFAIYAFLFPWSHTVFNIYAPAAHKWWAGEDIYVRGIEYYRYSPLFAIGLTPLALLPEGLGNALWKTFNIAFFAFGLGAWARRALPLALNHTQRAALFLLAVPLALHSMYIGQANLLMLGAVLLALAAAAEEHWNRAALWLALATLIKGYPLALGLLLAALYPRRFALRFVAALSLGLLVPFATQWPDVVAAQYASWWSHLGESTHIMRERLRSLDQLFVIYGQPLSPEIFQLLEVLAGGVVLCLCAWQRRREGQLRGQLLLIFLLFSVWVVLFGPATESCTYVVMAPAIAWSLVEAFHRPAGWATHFLLVCSLLLMGPLVTDLFGPTIRNFANQHGSQPLGALLFLLYPLTALGRVTPKVPQGNLPRNPSALRAA
jgi:hypothetical protein